MKSPNGMMLWTDAYLADTGHLSTLEHGAYLLILISMWRNGGTLPDDDCLLRKCSKVPAAHWGRIAPTIRKFLSKNDNGTLSQKRLKTEFERTAKVTMQRSHAGQLGSIAKSLKTNEPQQANGCDLLDGLRTLDLEERKEANKIAPQRAQERTGGAYAFEAGKIRLNGRDLEQWRKAFAYLELEAELLALENWAGKQASWFHAVKGALAKKNREAKLALQTQRSNGGANGANGHVQDSWGD